MRKATHASWHAANMGMQAVHATFKLNRLNYIQVKSLPVVHAHFPNDCKASLAPLPLLKLPIFCIGPKILKILFNINLFQKEVGGGKIKSSGLSTLNARSAIPISLVPQSYLSIFILINKFKLNCIEARKSCELSK
jgi:hypothetical protein